SETAMSSHAVEDPQQVLVRHRLRTLRIGWIATLGVLLAVAVYAVLPGAGFDRRKLLVVVAAQGAALLATALLPWKRLFTFGFAEALLRSWSLVSVVLIGVGVGVSGGGSSQLYVLYALTCVFFAVAYPLRW